MKRAALGALLICLVAGSTAMAGTVVPPGAFDRSDRGHSPQRVDNRNDNRGRHDNNHQNDGRNDRHHNWNDNNRRDDQRNDRRDNHRWDGRRNDHRNDHHWDGRRDDHRNDHRWNDNRHDDHRWNDFDRRWDNDHRRWVNPPRHDRRWENGRWHWGVYHRPHGYTPYYWRRGDRLPRVYYGSSYVIGNYYDCGLRAPPYGYHWVRVDHDVVLAAIATGVVLDVIYNQFW